MIANMFMGTTAVKRADPHFASVVLLADFDGDLTDYSNSGHVATNTGVTFATEDTPFRIGGQTANFNGVSYFTYPDSADWDFGSGDFTVEVWDKHTALVTDAVIAQFGSNDKGWAMFNDGNGPLQFIHGVSGGSGNSATLQYTHGNDASSYKHLAVSRVGNTLYMCYDGVIRSTQSVTGVTFVNSARPLTFGANNNGSSAQLTGRLSEARITKGVGRYSGSVSDAISVTAPFPKQ